MERTELIIDGTSYRLIDCACCGETTDYHGSEAVSVARCASCGALYDVDGELLSPGVVPDQDYSGTEAEWYHEYPQQIGPQPVYLTLGMDGVVSVDWSSEIGNTVPVTVWNQLELRWSLPETIHGNGVAQLIDEITPDLLTILQGWELDNTDRRGVLTETAEEAVRAVSAHIAQLNGDIYCAVVYDLDDALESVIPSDIDGGDIEAYASELMSDIETSGCTFTFTRDDLIEAIGERFGVISLSDALILCDMSGESAEAIADEVLEQIRIDGAIAEFSRDDLIASIEEAQEEEE